MNEEENQAFKILYFYNSEDYGTEELKKSIKIIVNLVEKQQKEIENYQILKDDIEGHNIAYVDTPEFEENYISKDKIKEKMKKEKEMRYYRFLYGNNQTPSESYKFKYTEIDMNDYAGIEVNRALKELLQGGQESDQEGGQEDE